MRNKTLIEYLQKLDSNKQIMFKVDNEIFNDEYLWYCVERMGIPEEVTLYWINESVYDDEDDFLQEIADDHDLDYDDPQVKEIAKEYESKDVILISISV